MTSPIPQRAAPSAHGLARFPLSGGATLIAVTAVVFVLLVGALAVTP